MIFFVGELARCGLPLVAFKYEELLRNPTDSMARLFAHCEVPHASIEQACSAMTEDAHAGTLLARDRMAYEPCRARTLNSSVHFSPSTSGSRRTKRFQVHSTLIAKATDRARSDCNSRLRATRDSRTGAAERASAARTPFGYWHVSTVLGWYRFGRYGWTTDIGPLP